MTPRDSRRSRATLCSLRARRVSGVVDPFHRHSAGASPGCGRSTRPRRESRARGASTARRPNSIRTVPCALRASGILVRRRRRALRCPRRLGACDEPRRATSPTGDCRCLTRLYYARWRCARPTWIVRAAPGSRAQVLQAARQRTLKRQVGLGGGSI